MRFMSGALESTRRQHLLGGGPEQLDSPTTCRKPAMAQPVRCRTDVAAHSPCSQSPTHAVAPRWVQTRTLLCRTPAGASCVEDKSGTP